MSKSAETLPDDPAVLKAMIAALQAENAKISATLRVHDQLVQALRLRIAKLQKLAFGKSSEKIEREIEQLELALEDLLIASAESATTPADGDEADAALGQITGHITARDGQPAIGEKRLIGENSALPATFNDRAGPDRSSRCAKGIRHSRRCRLRI